MDLKPASRRIVIFVACISTVGGLWIASQWWEKGLAQRLGEPEVSPGGCYRVETFKPYWVLPNFLHWESDVNGIKPPQWFPWWGYPGFYRLFDHRSGDLISETRIYDLQAAGGKLSWGGGSGHVMAGLIDIGPNLPDCMGDVPGKMRGEQ